MLKAKLKTSQSKGKQAALRDIFKEDDMRGLFARVPVRMFKKIHVYLSETDQTYSDWLKKKIEDI